MTVIEAAVVHPAAGAHTGRLRFHGRRIAAVLFTDIVGSAAQAHRLGDRAWCALLEEHDELVRRALDVHDGREIDASDDGFFAAFDGASAAIACAWSIREALVPIGLELRSGVHAGEFEERGARLGGIAAAVGARIAGSRRTERCWCRGRSVISCSARASGSAIAASTRSRAFPASGSSTPLIRHALPDILGDHCETSASAS